MSVLQTAGSSLLRSSSGTFPRAQAPAHLGVRSLREEYAKPTYKKAIPGHLAMIEERLAKEQLLPATGGREAFPRFQRLFPETAAFPPSFFVLALELPRSEKLNGVAYPFDAELLAARDDLVVAYKAACAKIRLVNSRELEELPIKPAAAFCRAWGVYEALFLRNKEAHAVEALQPLCKAMLALEPLLLSVEKEKLLPWPRVQHQKAVTLKCLSGFMAALESLAATVLPAAMRQLEHEPKLLLLMDHVLCLKGEKLGCLEGLSAAPEVDFKGASMEGYAFKLLGASVGDAVAAGKLTADSGHGQAGRAKMETSLGEESLRLGTTGSGEARESEMARRARRHARELLEAFEAVKEMLLGYKGRLQELQPALDEDQAFLGVLTRFERAFARARRLFLEPDNLA